jgi:hypothetical protein
MYRLSKVEAYQINGPGTVFGLAKTWDGLFFLNKLAPGKAFDLVDGGGLGKGL